MNNHYRSSSQPHLNFVTKLELRNNKCSPKLFIQDEYKNSHTKVNVICEHGHMRKVVPYSVIQGTSNCPKCNGKHKRTTSEFVEALNNHNKQYPTKQLFLIEGEEYVSGKHKLRFKCLHNHMRVLSPDLILSQHVGCAVCSGKAKKTMQSINNQLVALSAANNKPKIEMTGSVPYINSTIPVEFKCELGHSWIASVGTVLYSSNCPRCCKLGYSKKAIRWLNQIAHDERIHIQHAENGGEFIINHPTIKNFRVDGYCKETNTVYQFHGDVFHGNLTKFKPFECCHPYNKTATALELYTDTVKKQQIIEDCGFRLVVMWEGDYDCTISYATKVKC